MKEIYKNVRSYINNKRVHQSRKRLDILELEERVRSLQSDYYAHGGYRAYYQAIKDLEKELIIEPMKTKATNGMSPSLPKNYWILPHKSTTTWKPLQMIKVEDVLDLTFYRKNSQHQTDEEWNNILQIYQFINQAEEREDVSLSERSLELFGDEKYLSQSKLGTVSRLGLKKSDIKAKVNHEPFLFWLRTHTNIYDIQNVLIVENQSFFHTAIANLENDLLGDFYQVIIFGAGKKIEKSFKFFYNMFPDQPYLFHYVGDMDPEGYNIFARLLQKYKHANIQPATTIYRQMVGYIDQANGYEDHDENVQHRDYFLKMVNDVEVTQAVMDLWEHKLRIPQEVLTVETWKEL